MSQKPVTARPKSSEAQFVDLANQLEQTMLDPLRDGLRLEAELPVDDRDQVEQFLRHLEQGIQTIKLPAADTRQTLASLSEIQAELAKTTAMLDSTLIDARMKELGQIMDTADATKQLATALKEMDYKSAAEAWDAFAPTELDKPSQRSMASAAQELADKMDEAQLDPLARATRELGEALQHTAQNPETVARQKAAASQLGQLSRQLAARQAIAAKLASQKVRLDEAKGVARSGGEHSDRSRTPRQTWGRGPAPDSLAGDNPQRLDTQRQRTTIQGMAGQGPSQRDLVQSTEAAPAEDLEYNQRYQEFRRAAESVLEQEALPMGHRQTIRRYFEAIRPRE